MEVSKAVQNLGRSVIGNNTKAVLCIRDIRKHNIKQGKNAGIDAMGDDLQSVDDDISALSENLMKKAEASLKGKNVATWSDISEMAEDNNYIAIEVQYNPTSLRLDSVAGEQMDFNTSKGHTNLSVYKAPSSTTLSFELLFDDTNNMDAFMVGDNPLTGMTASNVANTVTSAIRGTKGGYSVQRQIQGILSLLSIPAARDVIFFWGNMSFHGQVTEVQATYTMFNKKGHPIRGKVMMLIRQGDLATEEKQAQDKKTKYDLEYWDKAFDETFQDAGAGGSFLDTANKFTNNSMLNLKL